MNYLTSTLLPPLLFYAVPIAVGFLFTGVTASLPKQQSRLRTWISQRLLGKNTAKVSNDSEKHFLLLLTKVGMTFSLGTALLLLLATLTAAFNVFHLLFVPVMLTLAGLGLSRAIITYFYSKKSPVMPGKKLLFFAFLAAVSYALWSNRSPYPLNWDLYEHQTLVWDMSSGSFSFFTNEMSDTFGFLSYPPTFHILLFTSQLFTSQDPADLLLSWQALSVVHLFTVILVTYVASKIITHNTTISLTAAVLSAFLFDSVISFSSHFLLPQTLAAVTGILLWSKVFLPSKSTVLSEIWFWLAVLGVVLLHFVIGGFVAILIIGSYSVKAILSSWSRIPAWIEYMLFLALVAGGYVLASQLDFSSLNRGEASSFSIPPQQLLIYMRQIYGYLLVCFVPVGMLVFLRKNTVNSKIILFAAIGTTALLATGLPYVVKFATISRFFWILLTATGIGYLFSKSISSQKAATVGAISTAFFAGIMLLSVNAVTWQQHLHTEGRVSHLSEQDIDAARFLQTLPSQTYTVISDPSTQYILEGLSGVNSVGGAFSLPEHRSKMAAFYTSEYSRESIRALTALEDAVPEDTSEKKLLVLSGRTFEWFTLPESMQQAIDFNLWRPHALSIYDQSSLQKISRLLGTEPIYQNSHLVIFELR